ncbi:MAG TPA: hypothetical protein VD903_05790 [Pseudonocardia sp.]|nr:hypothetical protein [Pseudonocardia sp.]
MNRTGVAVLLRTLLVACGVAVVLVVVVDGGDLVTGPGQGGVLLPFLAVAVAAVGLRPALPRIDRIVQRLADHRVVTPYSALAEAAARIRAGSLEQALPGLAQVLVDGTGAARAEVWLAVGERLVRAAAHPGPAGPDEPDAVPNPAVPNLGVLLGRPGTDHAVPVLEDTVLRAVLTIGKHGAPVTASDRRLVQDVANGAGLLLRGVALNAELTERVRLADDLARELQASRQRLATARDVERRRLVAELAHATADRLTGLRADVTAARGVLEAVPTGAGAAPDAEAALVRARVGLDELLERFRTIARGVYPAVLRDQGPVAALDEVAADLPRPVQLTGGLDGRLAWEIESGLYYVTAAAMQELAGRRAEAELVVHLARAEGRVSVLIDDPVPTVTVEELRAALAEDTERLSALGGQLSLGDAGLRVHAWLPDSLEPLVGPRPAPGTS